MRESLWAIRKAEPSDSAGLLKCLREAFEVYRSNYTTAAFVDTVLTHETLQQRLRTMRLLAAVSDSREIIGTIGCCVVDASEGHIRGMAVLPSWQGSGVAAELLRSVESELRDQGCSYITLETTEPLQSAMRFYEKNGFRRSGKITDFYGMPLFEYVKTLTPKK